MDSLNWKTDIENDEEVPKINWTALQEFAINLKNSKSEKPTTKNCHIYEKYNLGGLHLARILEFDDGMKWIARIQLHKLTSELEKRLFHEISTLSILREQADVPVPEVYGYETNPDLIGRAFMIMQFIPGNTGTDFTGFRSKDIPPQFQAKFYHEMARIHASLTTSRASDVYHTHLTSKPGSDINNPVPANRHDRQARRRHIQNRRDTRPGRTVQHSNRVFRSMGRAHQVPALRGKHESYATGGV
jgi:hypothetical protein